MQLYFIRHGQSVNNALYQEFGEEIDRSEDPELTPLGRSQADCLARFLKDHNQAPAGYEGRNVQNTAGFKFTHLYTSLMVRAVATGSAVAEALHLPLIAWLDLHEGGGIYLDDPDGKPIGQPGKKRSYFSAHYPCLQLPDHLDEHGWWNRAYEYDDERPMRARRVLAELVDRHGQTKDHVVFFSHGGFYNYFLRAILGMPDDPQDYLYWFYINNVGITRIDYHPQGPGSKWVLMYQNRLDYLPGEMAT